MFPLVVMMLLAMLTLWLARTIVIDGWNEAPAPSRDPDYIVERFTLTRLSETGLPRYVLSSDRMVHLPADDTSLLTRPLLRQAQLDQPEVRIRADRGVITSGGEIAYLHDNVEILRPAEPPGPANRGNEEMRVTTSYLRVLPDEDRADTTAPVRIEQAGSTLNGVGMEFDNRYRRLRLLSSVRATYKKVEAGPAPRR
jgi:lipopolysaccharide export system protein LptC